MKRKESEEDVDDVHFFDDVQLNREYILPEAGSESLPSHDMEEVEMQLKWNHEIEEFFEREKELDNVIENHYSPNFEENFSETIVEKDEQIKDLS